jgi:hypothetical protein
MRWKLGPASSAAGMSEPSNLGRLPLRVFSIGKYALPKKKSEPSLSVMTEIE